MAEHVVPLSSATGVPGEPALIDLNSGHTYDASGNSTGTLIEKTDKEAREQNALLSRFAQDRLTRITACSIASCGVSKDRDMLLEQARSVIALSSATPDQRQQALDIGVADVHIPSAMPNFISGYKNEPPVADIFSPVLPVSKQSDYYYQYDRKDAYQRALPTLGAAGAQPPEVIPRFSSTLYKTITRAVGGFVPTEVEANQDAALRIRQGTLRRMINVMTLEREIRVANMARVSGNWRAATTIPAGSQWNNGANSDPVKDFNNAQEASFGRISGAVIPEHIWNAMRRNPAVRSYYTYSGQAPGMVSEEQLMSLLQLPTIYVARMKYISTTGALSYVWGNDVVLFRSPEQIPPMDQEDVATSYTFRWNTFAPNVPDVNAGASPAPGMVVRQYFNQLRGGLGGTQLVLTHSDAEKMTSAYIGNLLINAYQ